MPDGSNDSAEGRSTRRSRRDLANQERLAALGEAIDQKSGVRHRRRKVRAHRVRRRIIMALVFLLVLVAVVVGGGYFYANYRFDKFHKIKVADEVPAIAGQPFNILLIGSDSRAGLSGIVAQQTGAAANAVAGQRSDVVKIVHIDPVAGTITMISIPRDTMVTLLANQSLYGKFNRINVNFGNGPSLLAQTITANFGIPIHQTIVVSFAGLINAADAIGGVYLNFPYPSFDPYSGLHVRHTGCQLIIGPQALALTRSRHFYYNTKGLFNWPKDATATALEDDTAIDDEVYNLGWVYDGSSDFGRIDRQDAFLRAMIDAAKKLYNPLTLNSFISKLPQGVELDSTFTLDELIGLAERFHSINANAILTYTLPVVAVNNTPIGDVLYVDQPYAQQQLVSVFGSQLETPSDPPPNTDNQSVPPPYVAVTTTTTTTTPVKTVSSKKHHASSTTTTTTTNPTLAVPAFDPTPCTP
jgi:LCP family protein required for cell wall assembly